MDLQVIYISKLRGVGKPSINSAKILVNVN